jgi:hypothetical protein
MPYVTVGSRHEFDFVPLRGPFRGHAGRLQLTIIRMSAKYNNSQCHFSNLNSQLLDNLSVWSRVIDG